MTCVLLGIAPRRNCYMAFFFVIRTLVRICSCVRAVYAIYLLQMTPTLCSKSEVEVLVLE